MLVSTSPTPAPINSALDLLIAGCSGVVVVTSYSERRTPVNPECLEIKDVHALPQDVCFFGLQVEIRTLGHAS